MRDQCRGNPISLVSLVRPSPEVIRLRWDYTIEILTTELITNAVAFIYLYVSPPHSSICTFYNRFYYTISFSLFLIAPVVQSTDHPRSPVHVYASTMSSSSMSKSSGVSFAPSSSPSNVNERITHPPIPAPPAPPSSSLPFAPLRPFPCPCPCCWLAPSTKRARHRAVISPKCSSNATASRTISRAPSMRTCEGKER